MLTHFRPAISFLLLMTLLTGVIYPLTITGASQILFPRQANGSLIARKGQIIGSELIGQTFTSDGYFHGRSSATTTADPNDSTKTIAAPYNAANSSGSNLGPTSQSLVDGVKAAAEQLRAENSQAGVPVDLVTASGSGLDPHVTPAAALFQVARVAKARSLPQDTVIGLVQKFTENRIFEVFGEPVVNVLKLNLELDALGTGSR